MVLLTDAKSSHRDLSAGELDPEETLSPSNIVSLTNPVRIYSMACGSVLKHSEIPRPRPCS